MATPNVLQGSELVLLDYSGTLSNDWAHVFEANQRLRVGRGLPRFTEEQWQASQPGSDPSTYLEFSRHYADLKTERGVPQLFLGAMEFLAALQTTGRVVEIISSHPQEHLDAELTIHNLAGLVSEALGSLPDKTQAIGSSLERAGCSPDRAVYVGDTVGDMRAGQRNAIGTIAVTYGYHSAESLKQQNPDLLVASLAELTSYLS